MPQTLDRNLARANAADAIALLEAFRNPDADDSPPIALLGAALGSISTAVRQTTGGEHGTPEWIAERMLADVGRMLELLGTGGPDEQRTAERYARRYQTAV